MEKVETPTLPDESVNPEQKRERVARCIECSNEWVATNGNESKPSRCPACMSRDVKWRDECTGDEVSRKDLKSTLSSKKTAVKKAAPEPEKVSAPVTKKTAAKKAAPKRNPDGSFAKKSALSEPEASKSEVELKEISESETPLYDKVFKKEEPPEGTENISKEFTYEDAVRITPKFPMQSIVFVFGALALVFVVLFLVRKIKGMRSDAHEEPHEEAQELPQPMPYFSFGGNLA